MKSCKEVAQSLAPGNTLTFFQKVQNKMHLFICVACQNYEKQLEVLIISQKKIFNKRDSEAKTSLNELEEQIIKKIVNK